LLVTLEVVAHGIGVDQEGLGDILRRAPTRQQHDRLNAVGFALVARTPVGRAQLGDFLGWEAIVDHAANGRRFQSVRLGS